MPCAPAPGSGAPHARARHGTRLQALNRDGRAASLAHPVAPGSQPLERVADVEEVALGLLDECPELGALVGDRGALGVVLVVGVGVCRRCDDARRSRGAGRRGGPRCRPGRPRARRPPQPWSRGTRPLADLIWPRRFLDSRRRRWEPRVGRVARRAGGGGASDSCRRAASRSRAAARLRSWERCSEATTVRRPSVSRRPRASTTLLRCVSLSTDEVATSNTSSTRLSVVLTPWPPGPADRLKRSRSSLAGMRRPPRSPGPGGTRRSCPGSLTCPLSRTAQRDAFLAARRASRVDVLRAVTVE